MGWLDGISGTLRAALGGDAASSGPALVNALLAQTNVGGLQGIVAKLEAAGLGTQVQSWLGQGDNLPITSDQLRTALGDEHVQDIARHLGLPVDGALKLFAEHLPASVDQASPTGTLPEA